MNKVEEILRKARVVTNNGQFINLADKLIRDGNMTFIEVVEYCYALCKKNEGK